MTKFLKTISLFFLTSILLIVVLFIVTNIFVRLNTGPFLLESKVHTLFIGDSQVEYAINDSLISGSKNIATSSEALMYSYYKLIKLKELNPHIDTVFLGFSFHTLSSYYDPIIYCNHLTSKFLYHVPLTKQLFLLTKTEKPLNLFIKTTLEEFTNFFQGRSETIGSFKNYVTDVHINDKLIYERANGQFYSDKTLQKFSNIQLAYLDKFYAYCKQKNITLILLNTPKHPKYVNLVPESFKEKYSSLITYYSISKFDFNSLELTDNDYLPDGDHLTSSGANKASRVLANWINN
ncbi:MAG: hypothetical protein OCC49_09375 [Fibrobacterales bacterium]